MASQFPQNLQFRSKDTAFPSGYSSLVSWDECVWAQPGDSGEEAVGGEVLTAQSVLLAVPPALSAAGGPPPHLACQGPQAVVQVQFSSVQFSRTVMSDSLQPHRLQHAKPPCPSPTPGVYSNSCPLSRWCRPTISSSVIPFSSRLQSFPVSGSFQMSRLFAWGGQSWGVSASASVLPMNTQDWSPLGWTGWISLQSKGHSRVFSNTVVQSINSSVLSFPYSPTLTSVHDYWKNHSLDKMDLCWQSNVQVRLYHTSIGVHHSAPKHPGPRGATHASLSTVVSTGSGLLEAFSWLRGACWTPPWGPEGPGFLLGWWRFYIKILWGPHQSTP